MKKFTHVIVAPVDSVENTHEFTEENYLPKMKNVNAALFNELIQYLATKKMNIMKKFISIRVGRDSFADDITTWIDRESFILLMEKQSF